MSDHDPNSSKRRKKKWRKKNNRQAIRQNNNAIGHEPHYNGANHTQACVRTGDVVSEGSSSQSNAVFPQLHQTGESSLVVHYTVANTDNNQLSTQRKQKRKKNRQKATQSFRNNSTHQDNCKPHCNGAFPTGRTVEFHPRFSSHYSVASYSQSTAVIHPQVITSSKTQADCEPSTSAHRTQAECGPSTSMHTSSSTVAMGPPNGQSTSRDSKRSSSAVVPSKQSNVQRTVPTGIPSKYMAIDCEMVGAGPKGHISVLARCSIVSYDGDVVYDKFITPPMPVTDYRTRWSGIRPQNLYRATPYDQARKEILKLVNGKVLIGHAIHNDLKVLNYTHPKDLTRDTSRIPLLNIKAGFDEMQTVSLKRFTKALLNRDIQTGKKGHSSVEDARATMELYRLVEVEWERTLV